MFKSLETELKLRGYSKETIKRYLWYNKDFIVLISKEPKSVNRDDVKTYLLHLQTKGNQPASVRLAWNALRFYYFTLWKRPFFKHIPLPKKDDKLPVVLTKDEVKSMIDVTTNTKHRAILILLYGAGLRLSDIVRLQWNNFFIPQKLGIVKCGKGKKDRYFIIPQSVLPILRNFDKKEGRLFPISKRTVQEIVKNAAKKARIKKRVTPHTLRHSFATHLLENRVDTRIIQRLLGHKKLQTTQRYTHLSTKHLENVASPADML